MSTPNIISYARAPYRVENTAAYSVASNTTLTVPAMQLRDSTNSADIVLASTITINSAVVGAAGLDTGTIAASTWYYIHVVGDTTAKLASTAIISASSTAPVLPFGYNVFALLGFALTDGSSHFLKMYVTGNGGGHSFYWDAKVSVSTGTATSYAAVSLITAVPPLSLVEVMLIPSYTPATAGNTYQLRTTGSSSTSVVSIVGPVISQVNTVPITICAALDGSSHPSIDYKLANSSDALTLNVMGFKYNI